MSSSRSKVESTFLHDILISKRAWNKSFGRRVDVVMPEAITNPIFREHVDRERTMVYGA